MPKKILDNFFSDTKTLEPSEDFLPDVNTLFGEVVRNGIKGQREILEDHLKEGRPLIVCDDTGRLVQRNPDGTEHYTTLEEWMSRK